MATLPTLPLSRDEPRMFDEFLVTINMWMADTFGYALVGCFLWGMVSVLFSPCHMASIPLMIGYVAGQGHTVKEGEAGGYAVTFSAGLFLSIAVVGGLCSLLGRMMGDVSPLWGLPVGGLLVWLGLDLMGIAACRLPGKSLSRFSLRGYKGAFILGSSYGILSGACTFGFIAPILAVITVQQRILEGLILVLAFAVGHCLPIAVAGSSVALSQRMLESRGMQTTVFWGRKAAGLIVIGVGIYFLLTAATDLFPAI